MKSEFLKSLREKKTVIGAIHFSPSPGFSGFDSKERALQRAQNDLDALVDGGVDSVIFENNYDLPHKIKVGPETSAFMTYVISHLMFKSPILFGVSVLWNDYETAFAIAKVTGASFVRIPAFVDSVETDYGVALAVAGDAVTYREKVGADVAILADVQVKHASMVDKNKTLSQSILEAKEKGADGIIITGKWTGDAPITSDLKIARELVDIPVFVGSGADKSNITQLFKYAHGVIVSTSLKEGNTSSQLKNPNLKSFEQRVSVGKVKDFMESVTRIKNL
jgi:uncharacterized protein